LFLIILNNNNNNLLQINFYACIHISQDRIALREAKLALEMSERVSLIDAAEDALRTDLYKEEMKEKHKERKEEDNHWYLLNRQALAEYNENEKLNLMKSLELDREIEEKGRQVEELNVIEEKHIQNEQREYAKIDRVSLFLLTTQQQNS
jgi:hypothetical protein